MSAFLPSQDPPSSSDSTSNSSSSSIPPPSSAPSSSNATSSNGGSPPPPPPPPPPSSSSSSSPSKSVNPDPPPPPLSSQSPPPKEISPPPPSTSSSPPPAPDSTPPTSAASPPPTPPPPPPPPNASSPPPPQSPPPRSPPSLPPPPPSPSPSPSPSPTPLYSPPPPPTQSSNPPFFMPPPPPLPPVFGPPSMQLSPPPSRHQNTPPPPLPSHSPPPTTLQNSSLSTSPTQQTSASSSAASSSGSSVNNADIGAIAAGSVAGVIIAVVAIFLFILRKRKKKSSDLATKYNPSPKSIPLNQDMYYSPKPPVSSALANAYPSFRGHGYHAVLPEPGGSKLWFTYAELKDITNGFSSENLLGEGGFGCVYKGCLPDGRIVAVKQLKVGSGQGEKEFRAEVEIISRVHHRHLVSLVGYCLDEHQRLLVYEYLPNKTLEYHLHEKGLPVMDWSKRVKIAIGSARGLAYLHEDCHPRIIHRDIKSANILLDNSFEAQVSDFGLAKLSNDAHSHVSTRVMGTFGYMAPEYASSGKLTDRSDVFSFGVVLLELITGRKPVDPSQPLGDESLVEWVRPLLVHALETGEFEEFVDSRLEKIFVKSEMMLMIEAAAACVRHSASKRPRMAQVVRAFDNECDLSDLSNGMKFGHSTIYNSAQYAAEIQRFHSSMDCEDFSSNYDSSREHEHIRSAFSGESLSSPRHKNGEASP